MVCGVGWRVNITEETWIHEADCSLEFWMLLLAYRIVTINSNNTRSSHTICEVHCRWRWDFRTFIVNCNTFFISVKRIFHLNLKLIIRLTVSNFSFIIATHHTFCMCKFKQIYRRNHSELSTCSYQFFSHSSRHYRLPKYGPFLLNRPVCFIFDNNLCGKGKHMNNAESGI